MRLELDGITAGYGATTVLRDVCLTVPDGCSVALLGPNGAGKTTLLSVASGLVSPTSGTVRLDRADAGPLDVEGRAGRGLCHITETGAVFPALTVAENLRVFAPRTAPAEAIERAVVAFPRLGQRLGQVAGTMSGGEQRMLALARAYAGGATTVLLDEMSMGLAPMVVDEIFAFLARLAAEGISLLIVEQYVTKALAMADLVYVLVRGRIAWVGEPAELDAGALLDQYLGQELVP